MRLEGQIEEGWQWDPFFHFSLWQPENPIPVFKEPANEINAYAL